MNSREQNDGSSPGGLPWLRGFVALTSALLVHAANADTITVCVEGCDHDSIQAAVDAATDGDVVEIGPGTFLIDETISVESKEITIRGSVDTDGLPATTIDGQSACRILYCSSLGGPNTLENLIFFRGHRTEFSGSSGGGVYAVGCVQIDNCRFDSCRASYRGGGLYLHEAGSSSCNDSVITSSSFESCSTLGSSGDGGGMYAAYTEGLVISSTSFNRCASGAAGGGLSLVGTQNTSLSSVNFTLCTGWIGGGLISRDDTGPTITHSSFDRCSAFARGGGILILDDPGCLVNSTTFVENVSPTGSAITCDEVGSTFSDSVFCGNSVDPLSGPWSDGGGNCFSTDCVDPDGDGTFDCIPWSDDELWVPDEYPTIESAFAAALDGATIHVSGGIHPVSSTLRAFNRQLTIRGSVDKSGMPETILDAGSTCQIMRSGGGIGRMDVRNLVFRNGSADAGGGLGVVGRSIDLENCRFENCSANSGGGISFVSCDGSTIRSVVFEDCVADSGGGGGLISGCDGLVVVDTRFDRCVSGVDGGSVYMSYSDGVNFENTTFKESTAGDDGGALFINSSPVAMFTECAFEDCVASIYGGAARVYLSDGLVFDSVRFESCSSGTTGAVLIQETLDTIFSSTSFLRCVSVNGGTIGVSSGACEIVGCDFIENESSSYGHAVEFGDASIVDISETFFCGHAGEIVRGAWADDGTNCIKPVCRDVDGDGEFDCFVNTDPVAHFPGEYETLQMAVDSVIDGGVVEVGTGTFQVDTAVNINGKNLTLRGRIDQDGEPASILDGNGASRIVVSSWGTGVLILENLTFLSGNAAQDNGGGLFASVPVQATNCRFVACEATWGGGVYLGPGSNGSHFSATSFSGCLAEFGGGLYLRSTTGNSFVTTSFRDCSASNAGGAIRFKFSSATCSSASLVGCTASYGGGIGVEDSEVVLTACSLFGNEAILNGGAIQAVDSTVQVASTSIEANVAGASGGVAWLSGPFGGASGLSMESMILSPNEAPEAPGIITNGARVSMEGVTWTECCLVTPYFVVDLGGNDLGWPCDGCIGDVTCDGAVTSADVGRLLAAFSGTSARYDLDENGIVDGSDLGLLFAAWGDCGP